MDREMREKGEYSRDKFEAGQREAYDFGWRTGKRAGIREVVEGYRAVRTCMHMVGYHHLADCKECEQAKLKEWGVK